MIVLQLITMAIVAIFGVMHMATMQELTSELTALKDQTLKAKAEILAKVAELEAIIAAGGGTTPDVDAALAALKAEIQGIDDLNVDAPTP